MIVFRPFSSIVYVTSEILRNRKAFLSLICVLVVVSLIVGLGTLAALGLSWSSHLPKMVSAAIGLRVLFALAVGWLFYKLA